MEKKSAAQLTCTIYNSVADRALATLQEIGVKEYHSQPSRATVLRRREGLWGIGAGLVLEEEPATRLVFHVPVEASEDALQAVIAACGLQIPGRGSAVCDLVEIAAESVWDAPQVASFDGPNAVPLRGDLSSIVCTVQQDRGNHIARSALDLGVPMPQVTTGEGTGLRDKLSLIRITVPAAKEIVHVTVSQQESDEIFASLITAGRINEIGSGFIYESPDTRGIINNMVVRGQQHSASMEQLIAAVDTMQGSSDWRRRALSEESQGYRYLNDLVCMILVCNEGHASDLVIAAMASGAAGATISKQSYARFDGELGAISPARETAELIVGQGAVDGIYEALQEAGLYEDDKSGFIALKKVSVACTHLGPPPQ
jgi:hypothetical protein